MKIVKHIIKTSSRSQGLSPRPPSTNFPSKTFNLSKKSMRQRESLTDTNGYTLLHEDSVPNTPSLKPLRALRAQLCFLTTVVVVEALIIIALLWPASHGKLSSGPDIYFPADSAIKYEIRTFTFGVNGDISPYQGRPSPQLDKLWEELYSVGFQRLPKHEAAKLPNRTVPIPDDPEGFYITELDVFHQLHCLNVIRKALYPDYYPDMRMGDPDTDIHIDHCVDSIRQSLMCSADISTIVWQWSNKSQKNVFKGGIAHKCRNFRMIQDWALERTLLTHFNESIRIEDNIHIPIYHSDGSKSQV